MSYGHADNLAHSGKQPGDQKFSPDPLPNATKADTLGNTHKPPVPLPPEWYARSELAPVLTGHDIGALYRWLNATGGLPHRKIAALTGTTQPQVADIITGRRARVQVYDVLVRAAAGLNIPRERMGLSFWGPDGKWYGPPDAYPGGVAAAHTPKEVSRAMLRRHLIAFGGITLAGVPVDKVGELLDDLGELPQVSLPSQVSQGHVVTVRDLTRRLAEAGNTSVADPQVLSDAAARMSQFLELPGPDSVVRALRVAVAELRIEAGWAAFDAGLHHHCLYHFARALELARQAGDAYCQAIALGYAGLASIEDGHPNDGLKMTQAAQVAAWSIPSDDQRAVVVGATGRAAVEACQLADAATALAALGEHSDAARMMAAGRGLWTPSRADRYGDLDRPAARLELLRGRLDVAEQLAAASVRRCEGISESARTHSSIVLATIHVTAGEQRGLQLAHSAITHTTKLTSVRVRRQLLPLADALEARPGSDARELARMARQVAA